MEKLPKVKIDKVNEHYEALIAPEDTVDQAVDAEPYEDWEDWENKVIPSEVGFCAGAS